MIQHAQIFDVPRTLGRIKATLIFGQSNRYEVPATSPDDEDSNVQFRGLQRRFLRELHPLSDDFGLSFIHAVYHSRNTPFVFWSFIESWRLERDFPLNWRVVSCKHSGMSAAVALSPIPRW